MSIINEPDVSKTIAWMYRGTVAFIGALMVFFAFSGFFTPMGVTGIGASIVLAFVEVVMLLLLRSLYRTRYILTEKDLIIKTTRLIGGGKRISLKTIKSLEQTLIPFGIRIFGSSFHGGYYQIPNLGRAFLTITNFHDGLLIKTQDRNYIITPKDSTAFKEAIETRIR